MSDLNHTRVSTNGGSVDSGRPIVARLHIERRMGKSVEGEMITILFGNQMLVGRDESCDIYLPDDRISRKHAQIKIDSDAVRVSDLGSTNGTTRNDDPVTEEIIIESGDLVDIGHAKTYEARIVTREDEITSVRLASGNDAFLLVPQEFIIGFAGPDSDDIDFKLYDTKISKRHARIEYFTGMTFIVSLDEDNLVVVDSKPVRELELRDNYLIELGDTLLRFERPT